MSTTPEGPFASDLPGGSPGAGTHNPDPATPIPGSPFESPPATAPVDAAEFSDSDGTLPDERIYAKGEEQPLKKRGSFWKELPILILIAFGLALLIKSFLIQAFYIPSESMVPTLNIGDRVLVNKVVYHLHAPRRGDVIVFVGEHLAAGKQTFWQKVKDALTSGFGGAQPRERDFIKRVIGLPGETVQITSSKVTITPAGGGAPFTLREPYIAETKDNTPYGPFVVPKDQFFVLGDNRPNSSDSRFTLGPIKRSEIVGRAFVRIWPLKRFHIMTRPDYAGSFGITLMIALWRERRRRRRSKGSRGSRVLPA